MEKNNDRHCYDTESLSVGGCIYSADSAPERISGVAHRLSGATTASLPSWQGMARLSVYSTRSRVTSSVEVRFIFGTAGKPDTAVTKHKLVCMTNAMLVGGLWPQPLRAGAGDQKDSIIFYRTAADDLTSVTCTNSPISSAPVDVLAAGYPFVQVPVTRAERRSPRSAPTRLRLRGYRRLPKGVRSVRGQIIRRSGHLWAPRTSGLHPHHQTGPDAIFSLMVGPMFASSRSSWRPPATKSR